MVKTLGWIAVFAAVLLIGAAAAPATSPIAVHPIKTRPMAVNALRSKYDSYLNGTTAAINPAIVVAGAKIMVLTENLAMTPIIPNTPGDGLSDAKLF